MELDAISGAALEDSVFDLNDDGIIDANDFPDGVNPGSSTEIPPTLAPPTILDTTGDDEYKLTSGLSGEVTTTQEAGGGSFTGRQSWFDCGNDEQRVAAVERHR